MKRFLRDLHRGQEREGRDKDRAKAEVERLNGVVTGHGSSTAGAAGTASKRNPFKASGPPPPRQVTAEERKRQMAQLAEMGIAVPEEFRGDLALAGNWQVVAEHRIKSEGDEEEEDKKTVRIDRDKKRKMANEESDSEEEEEPRRRKPWGSTIKTYPGGQSTDNDLDTLLASTRPVQSPAVLSESQAGDLPRPDRKDAGGGESATSEQPKDGTATVKREPSDEMESNTLALMGNVSTAELKTEPELESEVSGVVFKKRKAKNIRQK